MPSITAPGKLWALMLVIAGCFAVIVVSAATGNGADVSPAWAAIGVVTTYLVTNGVGARRGQVATPVFAPTDYARAAEPLSTDERARMNALFDRLAALDENERAELRNLAVRGAQ